MSDITDFLSSPLPVSAGQPLRVTIYSRLSEAIRGGLLPPGSMLPKESELGTMLGVSRTVVREALMLLEEDGLLLTRRGIGRFVSSVLPTPGLENLLPPEKLLSNSHSQISLKRIDNRLQKPSDLTHELLRIGKNDDSWFCESLVFRDECVIALVQEHLPTGEVLNSAAPGIAQALLDPQQQHLSVHALLMALPGTTLGPGLCTVQAAIPGDDRGHKLGIDPNAPVMVQTQSFMLQGNPFYLAKIIITPGNPLRINQPAPGL
ncbi:GntR family transcriptional regulator [Tatumella morbirosei]|uniref:GntR family transcriptional regulator n=1 Tax=Tatumella morbirosei TaxID=642227 RepID=UPI00062A20EC|nr:GntR family transcriptional regulator [Tatumella morbirosei]